jgi:outer membrane protein assembly factor BamB
MTTFNTARFVKTTAFISLVSAGLVLAGAAQAASLAVLTGDRDLAMIDTSGLKVGAAKTITGIQTPLAGIDVRPADGMLYGVTVDGQVVTIDAKTGVATPKVKLDMMIKAGIAVTVDFNPVADRMRIIGADGTSLRANVDDGKVITDGTLKYADADANKGKTPMVTAGAYSNSVKGTKETALYDLDTALGVLVRQAPPNDGILNTLGMTGLKGDAIAFDIETNAAGVNTGWAVAADGLFQIDIASGKATSMGKLTGLKGKVRDVAVLPAM